MDFERKHPGRIEPASGGKFERSSMGTLESFPAICRVEVKVSSASLSNRLEKRGGTRPWTEYIGLETCRPSAS